DRQADLGFALASRRLCIAGLREGRLLLIVPLFKERGPGQIEPLVAEECDQMLASDIEVDLEPRCPHAFALQHAVEVGARLAALSSCKDVQVLRIEVVASSQHVEEGDL